VVVAVLVIWDWMGSVEEAPQLTRRRVENRNNIRFLKKVSAERCAIRQG
jgi:hypothetical protein